jgi:3-hydroxybutyryl-CoA dehydratase
MTTAMYVGQKASFSRTVSETDIVQYAGLSGDFNPIHIDKEYASKTRFGQRISHGLLTTCNISRILGMYLPGPGSIYVNQSLQFVKPVFIGDTITTTAEILEILHDKGIVRLKTECHKQDGKLVLEGEATMLVPKKGE